MKSLGLAGFRTMILKPVARKHDTYITQWSVQLSRGFSIKFDLFKALSQGGATDVNDAICV